jgi:hypothetical protein
MMMAQNGFVALRSTTTTRRAQTAGATPSWFDGRAVGHKEAVIGVEDAGGAALARTDACRGPATDPTPQTALHVGTQHVSPKLVKPD